MLCSSEVKLCFICPRKLLVSHIPPKPPREEQNCLKWKKFLHHVNDTHIELTLTLTVSCKENALNSCIHPLSVILEQVERYETTEWSPVKTLDPCNLFHQVISFLKSFQHKFKVFSSFSFSLIMEKTFRYFDCDSTESITQTKAHKTDFYDMYILQHFRFRL